LCFEPTAEPQARNTAVAAMAYIFPAAVVLACLAHGGAAAPPNYLTQWNEFKNKYGKVYNGIDEEPNRFIAFETNIDFIIETNAKNLSFALGINQFSDLTSEEFKATYLGLSKPKSVWGDFRYLGRHTYSGNLLPDSVDWAAQGAVAPVKNQGQCGSCWAFSTTGALEGAWQIANNKTVVALSEQQFVDCDTKKDAGCRGGSFEYAFAYAEQNAICTEESYGFKGIEGTCEASKCAIGIPKGSVTGFKDVATEDANALMEAVAQGPVSVGIDADSDVFKSYSSGVLDTTLCGARLDHAVLVVGYGMDNGKDYWKVKNSFGESWGDEGYIRIARKVSPPWQPWTGECGILINPSYPVVKAASTQVDQTAVVSDSDSVVV